MEVTAINILEVIDKLSKVSMADFNEWLRNHQNEGRLLMNCGNAAINGIEANAKAKANPEAAQMPKQQEPKQKKQKSKQQEPKQEPKAEQEGTKKELIPEEAVNRFLACCLTNGHAHFVDLHHRHKVPQFMFKAMFGFLGEHMKDDDEEFRKGVIQLFIDKNFSEKPKAKSTKAKGRKPKAESTNEQTEEVKASAE